MLLESHNRHTRARADTQTHTQHTHTPLHKHNRKHSYICARLRHRLPDDHGGGLEGEHNKNKD